MDLKEESLFTSGCLLDPHWEAWPNLSALALTEPSVLNTQDALVTQPGRARSASEEFAASRAEMTGPGPGPRASPGKLNPLFNPRTEAAFISI